MFHRDGVVQQNQQDYMTPDCDNCIGLSPQINIQSFSELKHSAKNHDG